MFLCGEILLLFDFICICCLIRMSYVISLFCSKYGSEFIGTNKQMADSQITELLRWVDSCTIVGETCVSAWFWQIFYLYRQDKLLYTLALLKLNIVRKKVLLFANSIDNGFRLRLFLESFGIRSALVNAEQPLNSRHHILQVSFNASITILTHSVPQINLGKNTVALSETRLYYIPAILVFIFAHIPVKHSRFIPAYLIRAGQVNILNLKRIWYSLILSEKART